MEYFLQQTVNGLTLGSIYGLIALGYTMVYGIVGMINFAHGEIYMIGAFISLVAFAALGFLGITWLPAAFVLVLLIAVAFTCAYGWTLERLAYRPLRNSFRLAPLISAIGASIFLQSYVQILQGARTRSPPSLLEGGFTAARAGSGRDCLENAAADHLHDHAADGRGVHAGQPHPLRPRAACGPAGQDDGQPAGDPGGPRDFHDLRAGRGAGSRSRAAGDDVLRICRLLHRLSGRAEGVHCRGAGRHRLGPRRDPGGC